MQTKKAFHIIWKLPDNDTPFLDTVVSYLRSYLLIGLVAFLLLVTPVFSALLIPAVLQIEMLLPVHLISLLTFVVSFSFVTLLFAATYKTLAGVRLSWSDVLPGSALAALLFAIGNFCIEAYVKFANIGSRLWSGRLAGGLSGLDLLLGADLPLWGGMDQGAKENV